MTPSYYPIASNRVESPYGQPVLHPKTGAMLPLPSLCLLHYNPSMDAQFGMALLRWYQEHARELPWRRTTDPYAIWVSEVMLQQTRVETVIPYYERWMVRLPSIQALAQASRQQVLRLWEGLGYYQRAHNLHRAARILVERHEGEFPQSVQELQDLPGVGPYIAAAICAIAFNQDRIALDGNLRRVFSRLLDLKVDPRSPDAREGILQEAAEGLPSGRGSAYNQALMDLGSMICTPRQPACNRCPTSDFCLAFARGTQAERPIRDRGPMTPHHTVTAGVWQRDGQVFIARRPESGLLGGLWEFPGGKCEGDESLEICLQRELMEELGIPVEVGEAIIVVDHAYTHFHVTVHAFSVSSGVRNPKALEHAELRWVDISQLSHFPMGKVDREISRALLDRRGG
jgi:A/G-specific adenine glycosylase